MNLRELSAGKEKREVARGPLQEAIDIGNDLIGNPTDEREQFREEAVQDGFENLEYALDRYRAAHTEIRDLLILEAWKGLGGEDKAVVERVLVEDSDMYNVRPFIGEAMSMFRELKVLRCTRTGHSTSEKKGRRREARS